VLAVVVPAGGASPSQAQPFAAAQQQAGAAQRNPAPPAPKELRLLVPTPLSHYEEYDVAAEAMALGREIMLQLDPATMQLILSRVGLDLTKAAEAFTPEEMAEILDSVDLEPWRWRVLDLLLHQSQVLEVIPEWADSWVPLVHDSLLVVLGGMSMDRIHARILEQLTLPADADRGERILAFASRTPSFQKIGQILARYSAVPPDLRRAFQTLESSISTTTASELIAEIETAVGPEILEQYQFVFEDEVLSEASVGAVIGASVVLPGESERRSVVVKYIKPYAITAIDEDLEGITVLLEVLEANRDFYGIGESPLLDMFSEVRSALAREIRAAEEQGNLRRAAAYFADDDEVMIPALCDCSTPRVTVMERIAGVKITEAFPDDPGQRRKLAARLADVMAYEVLLGKGQTLFHGDPHAGNVFYTGDAEHPYRIALLDWGLCGDLKPEQRAKLVQVWLGLYLKHYDRLRENVDGLLAEPIDVETDRARLDAVIDRVFQAAEKKRAGAEAEAGDDETVDQESETSTLDLLDNLLASLAVEGYVIDPDILLFTKSLFTTLAVASDLDPEFKAGGYISGRVTGQVFKETPKRLLNTIWVPRFTSHDYESMMSNVDMWAMIFNEIGLGAKAVGVGIWKGIKYPFTR
jgi:ubiquinone biosynthesis protein